jgi:ribosomal-protein-alanine N-acetyltransferase
MRNGRLAADAVAVGARVCLRPPRRGDRDEVIRLNRASARFHRNLAAPPRRPAQFVAYLRRCRAADYEGLLVCRMGDGAIVGSINLSQIFRGNFRSAYLGYHVGASFAGRGYMTEAIGLALRHAFQRLRLHRLEANIQPGNAASLALVRRAGFVREGFSPRYLKVGGRWRDHERWAILAEDWRDGRGRTRASGRARTRSTLRARRPREAAR